MKSSVFLLQPVVAGAAAAPPPSAMPLVAGKMRLCCEPTAGGGRGLLALVLAGRLRAGCSRVVAEGAQYLLQHTLCAQLSFVCQLSPAVEKVPELHQRAPAA